MSEKMTQLVEEQLEFLNQQNKDLTKQNKALLNQLESLTAQVRQLTQMIYGSRSEKSKYQAPDGQCSLFDEDPSFNEPEQTEEQSTETVTYTVTRLKKKKRNDSFVEGVEVEEIHHHPTNLQCDGCQSQLHEIGSTIAREEARFIPAKLVRVQHIEHAYECKQCKKENDKNTFIERGKAPTAVIPRSIAGPTVLAKIV